MPVERVPLYDILEMMAYAKQKKALLLGPGSIGIIGPGVAAAGWLGVGADALLAKPIRFEPLKREVERLLRDRR